MKNAVVDRIWRRIRRSPQPDPTLAIATPTEALDAAAQLLNNACPRSVAVALWANIACRPLAALLYTASPAGNANGMPWVRLTAACLRHPDGWDVATDACAAINPLLVDWFIPAGFDQRQPQHRRSPRRSKSPVDRILTRSVPLSHPRTKPAAINAESRRRNDCYTSA